MLQCSTAIAALKAAAAASEPCQQAAARAASAAAALAYMHPDLVDANQLKHLYGPVVYTTVALELDAERDAVIGERVIAEALDTATRAVRELARSMPAPPPGSTRMTRLHFVLDAGLREAQTSNSPSGHREADVGPC